MNTRTGTIPGEPTADAALRVLEQLGEFGIQQLPPRRTTIAGRRSPIVHTRASDPGEEITGTLSDLEPLSLRGADADDDRTLWRELVDRHHHLGCPHPFGSSLHWFVTDARGRRLGCLLVEAGSRQLPARDDWIGWNARQREQHLHLVVQNSRFLILPWVRVGNLASRVLSMATSRLAGEWERRHQCRPVLIETFVDPTRFDGASCKAANREMIGRTAGKKSGRRAKPAKDIHVKPLTGDFRDIPRGTEKPGKSKAGTRAVKVTSNDPFVAMWQPLIGGITELACTHDRHMTKRNRALNSLLIIMSVFRLVPAPRTRGHDIVLSELWEQCRRPGISLPQPQPVARPSIAKARQRVDPDLFCGIHKIMPRHGGDGSMWKGHRILAIDGSRMNLPRPLVEEGYPTPNEKAHHPQGLVSCLHHAGDGMPITFPLSPNACGRTSAKGHFPSLRDNDIVVMDRGCFPFELLHDLCWRGVHPVFRLQVNSGRAFGEFINGDELETVVDATFGKDAGLTLRKRWPGKRFDPIPLRLVRITPGETDIILATTLTDATTCTREDIGNLYHQRWAIEELYKISRATIGVDSFHGQSEWNVRREPHAHFNPVAMTRLFTISGNDFPADGCEGGKQRRAMNFNHALAVVAANMEELMPASRNLINRTVARMARSIFGMCIRERSNRSFPRVSKQPGNKWTRVAGHPT